jgi:hypothetical protein
VKTYITHTNVGPLKREIQLGELVQMASCWPWSSVLLVVETYVAYEDVQFTKGVIRSRKLKDRQYNTIQYNTIQYKIKDTKRVISNQNPKHFTEK